LRTEEIKQTGAFPPKKWLRRAGSGFFRAEECANRATWRSQPAESAEAALFSTILRV
jgi:hypothetical protein